MTHSLEIGNQRSISVEVRRLEWSEETRSRACRESCSVSHMWASSTADTACLGLVAGICEVAKPL